MRADSLERLQSLQNILADFNHDLGQPVLGPGIICDDLIFLVVLIIDFVLATPDGLF